MKSGIAIIDYGMGNLHSVAKAVARVAPDSRILVTGDRNTILAAERVIFPGVGAIRDCMGTLHEMGLATLIGELAQTRPVLAVCVGMQALMTRSDENDGVDCLDLLPGQVRRFQVRQDAGGAPCKVPHMGWNQVRQARLHPLWDGIEDGSRFYFVHSYHVLAEHAQDVAAHCEYGVRFAAALARGNLFATQFHPEKSQHNGLRLLRNFVHWNGGDA